MPGRDRRSPGVAEHPALIAATSLAGAPSPSPAGAALGVALGAGGTRRIVLLEARDGEQPRRRPTLLASSAARELELALRGSLLVAARGALCWVTAPEEEYGAALAACMAVEPDVVVAVLPPAAWRELIEVAPAGLEAALLVADLPRQKALAALLTHELISRGLRVAASGRRAGAVAARRAMAGIEPGGELGLRSARAARRLASFAPRRVPRVNRLPAVAPTGEAGQALPLVLGLALALVVLGAALSVLGVAATQASRLQRAADLAAVSAARSMRDDHARLFVPARLPNGRANPRHLSDGQYHHRAIGAARGALAANGVPAASLDVAFPGGGFAPTRVRVEVQATPVAGDESGREVSVNAAAEAYPAPPATGTVAAATAQVGGYPGALAERQGERMRPDVAAAFDRLEAAARAAGHSLLINSAFRSDAEQAALFAANPDPRWVAPPGTSLHRCATELDLGPATAYAWLAANADRFGFLRRYGWEPWHFGFVAGPAPCSAAGNRVAGGPDGGFAGVALPAFVPGRFRQAIAAAASRWNVSPAVLAAQLMAESNFNPFAVSPAGAQGIAQFMPATAAAYGLADPFDAAGAIQAQARLMSDLLRQFGSVELALAAYNAGPGAVAACRCVPPYPETRAYVARILGLLGGVGATTPPALEVRLVE